MVENSNTEITKVEDIPAFVSGTQTSINTGITKILTANRTKQSLAAMVTPHSEYCFTMLSFRLPFIRKTFCLAIRGFIMGQREAYLHERSKD